MTGLRNTGNILPNPDAIQEFKVQTNSYNVEYGRFSSGIINVITKSGTNRYKGSVFEYTRDGGPERQGMGLDAGAAAAQAQPVRRHAGRPDREGPDLLLHQLLGAAPDDADVPEQRHRADGAGAAGRLQRSRGRSRPTRRPSQPFACNGVTGVICANRLDPVAMKIINTYIPLANVPGNIWQGYVPSPYDTDEILLKIDHQLNTAHRLSGSYFYTDGRERDAGGQRQPAVGALLVQLAAAQPQRERHVGRQHEQDQPGVVLVQPQLRRPAEPAGDVADRPGLVGHHPGRARAAADHRQRLLHADQRHRRADRPAATSTRSATSSAGPGPSTRSRWAASSPTTRPSRTRCSTTTASSRSTTA